MAKFIKILPFALIVTVWISCIVIWYGQAIVVSGSCGSARCEDILDMMVQMKTSTKCYQKKDVPAFSAVLTASKSSYNMKDIVKFDKVWTNIGNGYDPSTGIFTVPKDGVYHFTFTGQSKHGTSLVMNLWYNNIKSAGIDTASHHSLNGAIITILKLKRADKVTIKSNKSGQLVRSGSDNWTTFSGFLISQ